MIASETPSNHGSIVDVISDVGDTVVFEKDSVKQWRRAVHKELRWLKLPSEDPVYRSAMVCAAVYCFGTNVAVLAEVSGQETPFVRATLKRLRKTRILTGRTLRACEGWEGKHGIFAMMLDAMVAAGELYRPVDETRSQAQKARTTSRPRQPRQKRDVVDAPNVFKPTVTKANPKYGLAAWETKPPSER